MRRLDAAFLGGDLAPPSQGCVMSGQVGDLENAESSITADAGQSAPSESGARSEALQITQRVQDASILYATRSVL